MSIVNRLFRLSFLLVLVLPASCLAQVPTEEIWAGGLEKPVTVRRDARSIPYIQAGNLRDLYFAQGYETARDRLWQMDLMRRLAVGRVAELFGKPALEQDRRWRTLGFEQIVKKTAANMKPQMKLALESYADGVNAYIATLNKENTPAEFALLKYMPEKWTPADTLLIGKIMADSLSSTWWQDAMAEKLKSLPEDKYSSFTSKITPDDLVLFGKDIETAISADVAVRKGDFDFTASASREMKVREQGLSLVGMFAEDLAASNNWVISGKRTIDGKAMLANDPHLRPSAPGIWYLTHLSAPGMRVSGVTFPGVPGVVLGHNENIAWGATNVGPDVQDLYVVELDSKNMYKSAKGKKAASIRKEVIKYRANLLSPELSEDQLEVVETEFGPVVSKEGNKSLALRWTSFDPNVAEFEAFLFLNTAKDWKEFRKALSSYGGPSQNFVYADVKGNIGWQIGGKIPLRRKGDGAFPYPSDSNDGDWIGFIPFNDLPMLFNPPSGFFVTANQRIAGTDYKYPQLIRQFAAPWRARRIHELVSANSKISMNDVTDIQRDVFNIPLNRFSREVVKRKAASPQTLELLSGWDGRMTADSKAAAAADIIYGCVGNKAVKGFAPAYAGMLTQKILPFDLPNDVKTWLPSGYSSWDEVIKACDLEFLSSYSKDGRVDFSSLRWGDREKASFPHPLAQAPIIGTKYALVFNNIDGSGQTPNVGDYVSMRHISSPGNWDETRFVIPLGQSGSVVSPHWKDQFPFWSTGKPAVFPFSEGAVNAGTVKLTKISPKMR